MRPDRLPLHFANDPDSVDEFFTVTVKDYSLPRKLVSNRPAFKSFYMIMNNLTVF